MNSIADFIRRNWMLILIVLLILYLPSSFVRGVFRFVLYFMLTIVILVFIARIAFGIWIDRKRREMENGTGGSSYRTYTWGSRRTSAGSGSSREGEIKVQRVKRTPEKKVRGDVGDYVDYEDVSEDKKHD